MISPSGLKRAQHTLSVHHVQEAIRLKEKKLADEVIAVSLGGKQCQVKPYPEAPRQPKQPVVPMAHAGAASRSFH